MADNNRLKQASEVIDAFGELMSSHRGEVQCTITSAEACAYNYS
jgi:F0F1-type ATP synthase delta subunit